MTFSCTIPLGRERAIWIHLKWWNLEIDHEVADQTVISTYTLGPLSYINYRWPVFE